MKTIIENLSNLVKVKTIVTLAVILVFVILALRGDIPVDNIMVIVSTVVAFYFGTQHEKTVSNSGTDAPTAPTGTVAPEPEYIPEPVGQATANEIHPPDLLCAAETENDVVVTGFAG